METQIQHKNQQTQQHSNSKRKAMTATELQKTKWTTTRWLGNATRKFKTKPARLYSNSEINADSEQQGSRLENKLDSITRQIQANDSAKERRWLSCANSTYQLKRSTITTRNWFSETQQLEHCTRLWLSADYKQNNENTKSISKWKKGKGSCVLGFEKEDKEQGSCWFAEQVQ